MGRWGELLFEGDIDLDTASEISHDAGTELLHYEVNAEDPEFGGKGLEATREHLNNGALKRLFNEYSAKDFSKDYFVGKELRLVFLAALGMRVGATIEPEHMDLLRSAYTKIPVSPKYSLPLGDTSFRGPAKAQFEIALAHYRNDGTPYDFYAVRCKGMGCAKAQDELDEGMKLLRCARCREAAYCGKECQARDWPLYKKSCKTPEIRAAEEERRQMRSGLGGFLSLNV